MEKIKLETNFSTHASLIGNDVDGWDVILTRKDDGNVHPITVLKSLTSAECYTRLGIDVPRKEIPDLEGRAAARQRLFDAMSSLSGRTLVNVSEINDILLDIVSALGEDKNEEK